MHRFKILSGKEKTEKERKPTKPLPGQTRLQVELISPIKLIRFQEKRTFKKRFSTFKIFPRAFALDANRNEKYEREREREKRKKETWNSFRISRFSRVGEPEDDRNAVHL